MPDAPEPRGLLHVEMACPDRYVEEFHAWYNTEHVPERLAIPGFVAAARYASLEGGMPWLATYEVETPAVLDSPAYLHWLGPGETAWTKRILPLKGPSRRTVFELISSERAASHAPEPPAGPPGLFSLRLTAPADPPSVDPRALLGCPGFERSRLCRAVGDPSDTILLFDLSDVWAVQQPEFHHRWSRIAADLVDRGIEHTRALHVRIL